MENTYNDLYQEYFCPNQKQAFDVLKHLFDEVGGIVFWLKKVKLIQEGVFGIKGTFDHSPPDEIIYTGQLFLKLIYASYQLQQFPPISGSDLTWRQLICPREERISIPNHESPSLFKLIGCFPKHLSRDEILDPGAFLRDFFSIGTLEEWAGRWNQLREYAFYQHSIIEGDEGEYLYDFEYLFKLTEACYLIFSRFERGKEPIASTDSHKILSA